MRQPLIALDLELEQPYTNIQTPDSIWMDCIYC